MRSLNKTKIPISSVFVVVSMTIAFRIFYQAHILPLPNIEIIKNKNVPPQFKVTICVITYNRLPSLQRLLKSINLAQYPRSVNLIICIDAGAPDELVRFVESYRWKHGEKTVFLRVFHVGLISAVAECWYPDDVNSYGLLLEDDTEVSPYFYHWLESAFDIIRRSEMRSRVYGISLYTPRVIETVFPYKQFQPDVLFESSAFLHQVPCSWGALYFPHTWRKFVKYLHHRLQVNGSMDVPGSRTNGWVRSWKKYFIELAFAEGLFMLGYPKLQQSNQFFYKSRGGRRAHC